MDFAYNPVVLDGSKLQVVNVSIQETGQIIFWCHVPSESYEQIKLVKTKLQSFGYITKEDTEECMIGDFEKLLDSFSQLKEGAMYYVFSNDKRYKGHHRGVLCSKNSDKETAVFWYPDYGYYEVHEQASVTVKAEVTVRSKVSFQLKLFQYFQFFALIIWSKNIFLVKFYD